MAYIDNPYPDDHVYTKEDKTYAYLYFDGLFYVPTLNVKVDRNKKGKVLFRRNTFDIEIYESITYELICKLSGIDCVETNIHRRSFLFKTLKYYHIDSKLRYSVPKNDDMMYHDFMGTTLDESISKTEVFEKMIRLKTKQIKNSGDIPPEFLACFNLIKYCNTDVVTTDYQKFNKNLRRILNP